MQGGRRGLSSDAHTQDRATQAYPKLRRRLASQAGARKVQRARQLSRAVNLPRLQVEKQAAPPRSWVHRPGCCRIPRLPRARKPRGSPGPAPRLKHCSQEGGGTRGPAGACGRGRSPCCCPLVAAAAAPRRRFHRL